MTEGNRASFDTDQLLDAVEQLYDASDGRDDLVGDVLDMRGDKTLALYQVLKMLGPYWNINDRVIDVLKKAPPKIAHDAEYILRRFGWIPWE